MPALVQVQARRCSRVSSASSGCLDYMNTSTNRKGFTLIELLMVVVIIGILALTALAKFQGTKDKAYFAALKMDLKGVIRAQEAYYADNQIYSTDLVTLNYAPSQNVTLTITSTGLTKGWSASGVHSSIAAAANSCSIHVGNDVGAGQNDGVVTCP